MTSNTAAWQTTAKTKRFHLKPAPYTHPGPNELVVRSAAWAINPVDWLQQDFGYFPLDYPTILGEDVAGEVVDVNAAPAHSFRPGQRVLGYALSLATGRPADGAFQEYVVLQANMAARIPDSLSFDRAVVLPLGLATAAAGLFQKGFLELQYPALDLDPKPTGQTLLVWGGASSVGSNAIQLAVAAGYEVITTASPRNFAYVKNLGASQAFDYSSASVADELVQALEGKTLAGVLDTVNRNGAIQHCLDVASRSHGKKAVASVLQPPAKLPQGVTAKYILAYTIKDNETSRVIFNEFLPKALAEGKYQAAPEPYVVGKGLEALQAGLEARKKGVSAQKIVVTA
ncbi:hypothetical protein VTN96DRAFT_8581 [Rasamsonia emersonii]|uniref:Zinc-binding oxidoreductase CipB n=1 Tax=Rasamsonia emersonii (strain ATCC 16479 / CBS 393.64 / IMI 116815) TaxID=1408163 RepID=A0A0F4YLI9_RASE3|nr:Zinc-binding oxidoreductase CipB [Rasamsonia emersonii CBS 393.64]KKA18985.1 Zinc-binding oxidoreductase CipB [Rasamsonia emersonii CBS 393.64]